MVLHNKTHTFPFYFLMLLVHILYCSLRLLKSFQRSNPTMWTLKNMTTNKIKWEVKAAHSVSKKDENNLFSMCTFVQCNETKT